MRRITIARKIVYFFTREFYSVYLPRTEICARLRVIIRKCEAALVNQSGMAVTNRYKNPKLSEG